MKDKKKSKNKIKVNFTDVETRSKIEDGVYHCKVVETEVAQGSAGQYIKWTFEIVEDGPVKGRKLWTNTSLAPQALWNLRNLLDCLGVETADSEMDIDLDACVDLEVMLRVEEEIYEGKSKAKVTDYTAIEETTEVDGDDDDDKKSDDDDEEEEEEEEEKEEEEEEEEEDDGKVKADEVREMDDKELADLVKLHKLKIDLTKFPKKSKKIGAVVDALEAKGLLAK